jgi:hypothetical protein
MRWLETPRICSEGSGFVPIGEAAGPVKSAIFGYNASCLFNLDLHAGAGWRGTRDTAQAGLRERGPRRSKPRVRLYQ